MMDSMLVCTDLLDDEVSDILKVSEGRWQIEECFRINENQIFRKTGLFTG